MPPAAVARVKLAARPQVGVGRDGALADRYVADALRKYAGIVNVAARRRNPFMFCRDHGAHAVEYRRAQAEFHARGEAPWQAYRRSGVSRPPAR